MANKEDEGDSSLLVVLWAVHIVNQVLDEADVIANAAYESGQAFNYLEMLRNMSSGKLRDVSEENISFSVGENELTDLKHNSTSDIVNNMVTSTPQKVTDDTIKILERSVLIGQGDVDCKLRYEDITTSSSMCINQLFDMSEVEHVMEYDDAGVTETNAKPNDVVVETMKNMLNFYVNEFHAAYTTELVDIEKVPKNDTSSGDDSGYSLLADACTEELDNVIGDLGFCIDNEVVVQDKHVDDILNAVEITDEFNGHVQMKDVGLYENAYITMNRDYDQCSEDDGDPILQDPKSMTMQEVELMHLYSSGENTPTSKKKSTELTAISAVSAISRKSSLAQRCRNQGARLLTCFRGLWRRKTSRKRKDARMSGVRGLYPLSPDARRCTASLLDQHQQNSCQRTSNFVWKFNTVSEVLVSSARWKNYTLDVNSQQHEGY